MCYYSTTNVNYNWMIGGRLFALIAVELLIVLNSCILDKWFAGSFVTISNGCVRLTCGIFALCGAYFAPELFISTRNLGDVMWMYAIVSSAGFFVSLIYYFVERKNEKYLKLSNDDGEDSDDFVNFEFKFKHIKHLSPLSKIYVFLVALNCAIYYMFTSFGTDCLMVFFNMSYVDAKNKIALLPLIVTVLTPVWSIIVSKFGKKTVLLFASSVMISAVHYSWHLIPSSKPNLTLIPIFFLGMFLAMYNSLGYVALGHSLPRQAVSTGFGLASSLMNVLLTLGPLSLGYVVKNRTKQDYLTYTYICFGTALVFCVLCFIAMILDLRTGGLLHLPENSEKAIKMREEMSRELARKVKGENDDYKSMATKSKKFSVGENKNNEEYDGEELN